MTPSPPEERVRAILAALDALPEGMLAQIAPLLPGPAGDVLRAVAAARVAPDREAAMRRVVEAHLSDLEAVARLFGGAGAPGGGGVGGARGGVGEAPGSGARSATGFPLPAGEGAPSAETGVGGPTIGGVLGGVFAGQLKRVEAELGRADTLATSLQNAQDELTSALDPLVERVADDRELATAARAAAAELRDPAITALVADITADAAAIRARLAALANAPLVGPPPDLADLEPRLVRLEARARAATALGQSLPERVAKPIAALAELARTRNHPAAAELAQVDARMEEMAAGLPAQSTRVKWRRALDLALAARRIDLAWTAGKRVQVEALDSGERRLAAVVAHRVADLAQSVGDAERATLARMEEALLLVRIPGFEEQGRALTEQVLTGSEAAPAAIRARIGLMAGQAFEALGDDARARTLYRRVMRLKDEAPAPELGRAALHLGRLELRGGQPSQGCKNVRFAYDGAVGRGDVALWAEAVPVLTEALVEAGREDEAAAVVADARARYGRMGHADAFRADLEKRWGAARVAAWWAG